ncbi:MAG: glycoside hydrolase family 2 protein [Candidatus Izemoplasmatales bacterium]
MLKKKIDLGGTWTLTADDLLISLNAKVPGSIYNDLLTASIIPDPFDQDNEDLVREYMIYDYVYERTFEVQESDLLGRQMDLVFEGLDTLTEVGINGKLILSTDNMHRTYRVDITEVLKLGKNTINVRIISPLKYIRNEEKTYPHKLYQSHDSVRGYIHLRKAHYMFGWDWGPQLPDGGIFRDVYIESIYKASINNVSIVQKHEKNQVSLFVKPDISNYNSVNAEISLELFDDENKLVFYRKTIANEEINIVIDNPKKWYPTGYGNQYLYTLKLSLMDKSEILDVKITKFGLREVILSQEKDQFGESFTFIINGIKVFAKGSNYIPEDNLLSRTTYELTYALLKAAKDANHNMIRVWGGGIYPPDYFYEICDSLGLMVWQDLMFACSIYPMNKKEFVLSITEEIIDNLQRIKHHPSIVLICGNNENETALENWNVPNQELSKEFYKQQYIDLIPKIVAEYSPSLPYWRSSPSSKELFLDTNSDNYGDMHYWGVWHNNEPFTNYRLYYPRFMSEFGLQSFPAIETINTFAREEDKNIFSYIMEKHQKNRTANSKILDYIGKLFKYPKDFNSLLYVSQAIQAEGIRYGVEHWRRNYGRCMGILYWQLNDCWPVASWSSIDYYHRWKILHYSAKKFYSPVLVSIEETGNKAKIYVTNDSLDDFNGILTYEYINFQGEVLETKNIDVEISKQSSVLVEELEHDYNRKELEHTFLYVSLQINESIVSENTVFFLPDKHLLLKKANISLTLTKNNDNYNLDFITNTLAKFVEVKKINEDIVFSDNYFHLIPGKIKTIEFKSTKNFSIDSIKINSLVDTY